ncbi:MAG: hypothetical protein IPM84_06565 [Anaerolineae bacterium]|nr:hypothetical protein [Anaerolineae bacterium]
MVLRLSADLFDRWYAATGGEVLGGLADPATRAITLTDPISATVRGLPMYAEEQAAATLDLSASQAASFTIEVTEFINGSAVGGSLYTGHTCRAEDLDCNGRVDVLDLQRAATAWNNRVGDPNYDLWADLDQDGIVTMVDIMRVAGAWDA